MKGLVFKSIMKIRIQKWGKHLFIVIPDHLSTQMGLKEGDEVTISWVNTQLVIARHYSLDALLAGITDENIHGEIDTGITLGREIW